MMDKIQSEELLTYLYNTRARQTSDGVYDLMQGTVTIEVSHCSVVLEACRGKWLMALDFMRGVT